ncbi:hypothetical protein BDU57DRAFT_546482 [Ampelomyces quisqualis]|uniref:Uncharacterized protein n=1 Tax=Ampelomyces quisqualis TaxID=50730 RepID=A0A6A5QW38_AMPQU|nr:hypothetical protein BDU57DRAFT_546482 [Ampelomyces quisqualis]
MATLPVSLHMLYRKQYFYDDFARHVKNRCESGYEALMNSEQWLLQHKTITQGLRSSKRVPMLLVGTPYYRNGAQALYAFATGLTVEYYCGYESQEYVWPLPEHAGNKVYFGEPLVFISGEQDAQGMTKSRRNGKALAELIISVIFLQNNELGYIENCQVRDLLQEFEYACVNFETNRDIANDKKRAKEAEYWANEESQETAKEYRQQNSEHEGMYSGVKMEPDSDDDGRSSFQSRANRMPSSARSYTTSHIRAGTSYGNNNSAYTFSSRGNNHRFWALNPLPSAARSHGASSAATPSRRSDTSYSRLTSPRDVEGRLKRVSQARRTLKEFHRGSVAELERRTQAAEAEERSARAKAEREAGISQRRSGPC